jgi:carboxylesterase
MTSELTWWQTIGMPLLPGAEPLFIDHDSPVGVLVLHGFTGSPKSMKPWGQRLGDEGWRVRLPRLPGHGTSWQDMNITTWQDWYSEADRNLRELKNTCEHVFVMGLSMGGSLTLRLAEQHGDAIRGIVLVNPAVHSERKDRHLLPIIKHVIGSFPGISNDIAKPGMDEGAYPKIPLKAAASLQQMWGVIRQDIARVTQPLLLFHSATDHVVEPSNSEWIMGNVRSTDRTEVVLERSYHVATLDYDADVIEDGSIAFVKRLTEVPA